jgi:hypothetical protein
MLKLLALISVLFFLACGKPPADPDPSFKPLVTYNVPTAYYNKYKSSFDWVTADIVSKTGKRLVRFVPNDNDPKYTGTWEPFNNFLNTGEAWVLFKEEKDQFTNVSDDAAGVAYVGSPGRPYGIIVLNFSISMSWTSSNFRQVVDHEVLHCLGFNHTFDSDYSIMNYDYTYKVSGVTNVDTDRLATAFPFSLEVVSTKDLEKFAAFNEREQSDKYAYHLMENFGLSESRAHSISRHLISYKKLGGQRALTDREKDILSKEILGFGFEKGKKALENYMQGEKQSIDELITVAANKNETSPEHIKELFGEIFLK